MDDALLVLAKRVSLSNVMKTEYHLVIISYYAERNAFRFVSTPFRSHCMRVSLNVEISIMP
jgi:hypothetical protein